jgi:GNAT superfamily N-acetyltransferase
MADETISEKLRDMAEHRGLKLVKSRKRKAGTGDYGKFGLTDLDGKHLLGVGDEGLTASPEEIEEYLRKSATSTWKASTESTPAQPTSTKKGAPGEETDEEVSSVIRPRARRGAGKVHSKNGKPVPTSKRAVPPSPKGKSTRARTEIEPVRPRPAQKREPESKLIIRAGRAADAAALVPLLSQLANIQIDELAIARNFDTVRKASGGMAVAERGGIVGFCSWGVLSTVQHGTIGRVSLLLVHEDHRRRGIATALLEAAMAALRKAGCARVEAMSDIEIANGHGFFRTLRFEQTSYRFARDIDVAQ